MATHRPSKEELAEERRALRRAMQSEYKEDPNEPRHITQPGRKGTHTILKQPRKFKMGGGKRCNATKASGHKCVLAAGWGTSHPGIGRCKWHGGQTPAAVSNAAKKELSHLLGFEMEIDPNDALMWVIRITAGEIHWLSIKLAQLSESEWYEHTIKGKELHLWARQREKAIDRLARFSKDAISLGLQERQIRVAEIYGETIARLLQGVLEELHLTKLQRDMAPLIVRKHLALLEQRSLMSSQDHFAHDNAQKMAEANQHQADFNPLFHGMDPEAIDPEILEGSIEPDAS